jgi:hypothetical protein
MACASKCDRKTVHYLAASDRNRIMIRLVLHQIRKTSVHALAVCENNCTSGLLQLKAYAVVGYPYFHDERLLKR